MREPPPRLTHSETRLLDKLIARSGTVLPIRDPTNSVAPHYLCLDQRAFCASANR